MSIGFKQLTPRELELLLCFNEYHELVLPDLLPGGKQTLSSLIRRGLVINTVPFKLTKKGIRLASYCQKVHNVIVP